MNMLKWSKNSIQSEFGHCQSLSEVVKSLEQKLWSQDQVICQIHVNGLFLSELEEAVAEYDLTVGVDLAARGSCTIGGMVATNAGGGEAFRNGVMRHRVLGLEAVLPDGSVMSDLKKVINRMRVTTLNSC